MKLEVVYGYNVQACSIGVVHLFLSACDRDNGRPLCGRRKVQTYTPAGPDDDPKCKTCLKLIGQQEEETWDSQKRAPTTRC